LLFTGRTIASVLSEVLTSKYETPKQLWGSSALGTLVENHRVMSVFYPVVGSNHVSVCFSYLNSCVMFDLLVENHRKYATNLSNI
jgi:hypothetical protein